MFPLFFEDAAGRPGDLPLAGRPTGRPADLPVFFFLLLPIEVDRMVLMKAAETSIPAFFNSAAISLGFASGWAA